MNDERTPISTDPWESEMSREFDKRVRHLHEAPLTFDNVRGKAMTIRRNRRIAVAGGVLAAAAVMVPVAVFAGNGLGDSGDGRQDFASNSPTPSQATDPNDPTPTEPPVGTLAVSYLEGSTWHRADGSTVELDEAYFAGVELGEQLVATSNDEGRLSVDVIDADGTVADSFDAYSSPVANADHTTIAYVAADGTLMTRWADGEVAMADGFVDGDSVAAITGGPNCFEEVDGCQVFVNHGDGSAPEVLDSHGIRDVVTPDAIKVNDVSPDGMVAAQTSSSDAGSCSAVDDRGAGAAVFDTCTFSFDDFSPGAVYLSGSDAYRDGIGQGYVVVLDAATGDEITRWEVADGFAPSWVWEDETHLLINAYEQGEWRLYRVGVDGSTEQVLSSDQGDDLTPAFTLLGGS
jgi:hypothetical protein